MMPKMMEQMFRGKDPESMHSMMEGMMPSMMDMCHSKMSSEGIIAMMHDMMPKMMDSCFAKINSEEQKRMLRMCREMLDEVEAKYKPSTV